MPTTFLSFLEGQKRKQRASKANALVEVERLASLLRKNFQFESLFLAGSLSTDTFRRNSDLDLIIKGIKIKDFFKAYAFLLKESHYPIDLKPFEDLAEDFQTRILEGGWRIG
jgi:predicted nucleotidyltransferase